MIHSVTLLSVENIKVLCIAISSETRRKHDVPDVEVPFRDLSRDPLAIMNVLEIVEDRTGIELLTSFFRDCSSVAEVARRFGTTADGPSLLSQVDCLEAS